MKQDTRTNVSIANNLQEIVPVRQTLMTRAKKNTMKVLWWNERWLWCILQNLSFQALKMSCIQVVAFIVFWTPYTVMATWSVNLETFYTKHKLFNIPIIFQPKEYLIHAQSAYIISLKSQLLDVLCIHTIHPLHKTTKTKYLLFCKKIWATIMKIESSRQTWIKRTRATQNQFIIRGVVRHF